MSRAKKVQAAVQAMLPEGELVLTAERCSLKPNRADRRRMMKLNAASIAIAVAALALGAPVALFRVFGSVSVWVVVTNERVLMFRDKQGLKNVVGECLHTASRDDIALTARNTLGVLREVTIRDTDNDAQLARLNLGIRYGAADRLIAA